MATFYLEGIPHTYVYRRWLRLNSGVQYIWETRDLRGTYPDTYMYLVRGNTIIASNDDYNGRASLIAYVPSVTGDYRLIIRGFSKYSLGTCDVYQSVGGGSPTKIDNDVIFGGYPVYAHWKADETILTLNAIGDTYLYIIHGNTMLSDDDSGDGLCSSIRPGYESYGTVVVGSYSSYSQGVTWLGNHYKSYFVNPGGQQAMDDPKIIISEKIAKFQTELIKEKPSLEKLSHNERETRVMKLRDSILSKDDINRLGAPHIPVPPEFAAAFEQYQRQLQSAEKELEGLSYAQRAAKMAKIEREKRHIFGNFVPQEER